MCTLPVQSEDSLIQSVHFYLGINGEENIDLDVIGFDYGRCTKEPITGAIREIGTLLLDGRAVHRFWIITENEEYSWGPEPTVTDLSRMEKEVISFDDQNVRPMGFYGSWKFKGLTSIGVIEFNSDCIPKDGVFKEPGESDVEIRIVERIKYITIKGDVVMDHVPLIIVSVLFFIAVAVVIAVCLWCIRRER